MRLRFFLVCLFCAFCAFVFCPNAFSESEKGPFEFINQDSTASLRVHFAAQLRADYYKSDGEQHDFSMEARRVRLSFSGFMVTPALTYKT